MPPYQNLISDSLLVNETIALLRMFGGSASAVKIVDYVMNIRGAQPALAKVLVQDIVEHDPRLKIVEDRVELVQNSFDARTLLETDFVVFDLETTGAKAPPCRIIEIGAFRVSQGKIVDQFLTLVNPLAPMPPFISALTGISEEMVRSAPVFSEVVDNFLSFIGDSVLVAHNAGFDMHFLNHEIGLVYGEYRMINPCLCTVQLSRKLLPDIENHKLKTLADHYSVSLINHHRAGDDARATAEIFINLLEMLSSSGVQDIASVKRFSRHKRAYV